MPSQRIIAPILPKRNYLKNEQEKLFREIEKFMKGEASRILIGDYKDTVEGWSEPPKFVSDYSEPYGTQFEIYVHPEGAGMTNWQRVSDGTGPRRIVSKKGMMHFRPEYQPKTTAGGSYGGSGAKTGPYIHTWVVGTRKLHRIEPREFSKKIKDKREKELQDKVTRIVAKVLR